MPKGRYIIECGLEDYEPDAVDGANTTNDLVGYLKRNPHPDYRLAACSCNCGNWNLIWERVE